MNRPTFQINPTGCEDQAKPGSRRLGIAESKSLWSKDAFMVSNNMNRNRYDMMQEHGQRARER
jgi:hypothetical protein